MRLLNTTTIEPEEFTGNIPEYAILSHTWGNEEFEYRDLCIKSARKKEGWSKITTSCSIAASEGWRWIWIDTCCIDKSSSAELSEAINSMFTWYEKAGICYAYLSDVPDEGEVPSQPESCFRRSRWFKRGWTLQELLAPPFLTFFNTSWKDIGTRSTHAEVIESITGISPSEMTTFRTASIAAKMYWASNRETLRQEDIAYCLLGLFGVSMPLLYGEGEYAFVRLQQEIIKMSHDESIFAWKSQWQGSDDRSDLLASSPSAFRYSANINPFLFDTQRAEFSSTNKGLKMQLYLHQQPYYGANIFLAPLNCTYLGMDRPLAVYLRKESNGNYSRYKSDSLPPFEATAEDNGQMTGTSDADLHRPKEIYIEHRPRHNRHEDSQTEQLRFLFDLPPNFRVVSVNKYSPGLTMEYRVEPVFPEKIGRMLYRRKYKETNSVEDESEGEESLPIDKRPNYLAESAEGTVIVATIKYPWKFPIRPGSPPDSFLVVLHLCSNRVNVRVMFESEFDFLDILRRGPGETYNLDRDTLHLEDDLPVYVTLKPRPRFSVEDYVPGYFTFWVPGMRRGRQYIVCVEPPFDWH